MCYEKRPKYLGAFTPAYKTYIMYFIKLLKLLLLSSPCHRESSTDRKVSEKQSLSGATDATRSKADPARTQVTTWGCCHLSLWAAVPGDARLGSWSCPHASDTHLGKHNLGNPPLLQQQTPLALAPWVPPEAPRGKSSPVCNQEAEERTEGGEGHCYLGKVPTIHAGRAGTQQVPDAPPARCSAPPAAPLGF